MASRRKSHARTHSTHTAHTHRQFWTLDEYVAPAPHTHIHHLWSAHFWCWIFQYIFLLFFCFSQSTETHSICVTHFLVPSLTNAIFAFIQFYCLSTRSYCCCFTETKYSTMEFICCVLRSKLLTSWPCLSRNNGQEPCHTFIIIIGWFCAHSNGTVVRGGQCHGMPLLYRGSDFAPIRCMPMQCMEKRNVNHRKPPHGCSIRFGFR